MWKQVVAWTIQHQPVKVEEIFRAAMQQSKSGRSLMAVQYVIWAYSTDVSSGSKAYKTVQGIPGAFSESLAKLAISKEKENCASITALRKLFDDALLVLGTESVGKFDTVKQ